MRILATMLAFLLAAPPAGAFSGNGRELYRKAEGYLTGRGLDPSEMAEVSALDKVDRLEQAAALFKEAQPQATSPREEKAIGQRLGIAYNKLSVEYDKRKQFSEAIDAARQAIQFGGDDKPVLHENIGAMYQESGDYYDAAQELEKARDLAGDTPERSTIVESLVAAYVKDGQTRDKNSYSLASQALSDELTRHAENPELWTMLGRCKLLEGDLPGALDAWKQSRQLRPFAGEQEQEFQRLATAVQVKRDFVRNESRHFVIDFDDKRYSTLADKLLDLFENAHDELGEKLGLTGEVPEKIAVTVYSSSQFDRTVRVPWAGGVHQENRIDLRVNPKWTDEDYADTVLHEYTHHLVSRKAAGKHVPAWVQEGVAMHSEKKLSLRPFYRKLIQSEREQTLMPISDLDEGFSHFTAETALLAYGESYDFVHWLIAQHGFSKVLRMLESFGEGSEVAPGFESAFGLSLEAAETAWRASLTERVERLVAMAKQRARQAAAAARRFAGVIGVARTPGTTASGKARARR